MAHLKRYSMPQFWPLSTKERTWVTRPSSGPHPLNECITSTVFLRDYLNLANNAKEAKTIVSQEKLHVDKKPRKDTHFPIGFMDIVELPDAKLAFRLSIDTKGLVVFPIAENATNTKLCKITGKTTVKKGKTQLNLHDGRNILVDKKDLAVGDSVLISLPDQKIEKHIPLQKDAFALIVKGKNRGKAGIIKQIDLRKLATEQSRIVLDIGGKTIETPKEYVIVGEKTFLVGEKQ